MQSQHPGALFLFSPKSSSPVLMTKSIAFLTSGGDSPGMNAAIRAIVRMSLYLGAQPFAIHAGYEGLLDDNISLMSWNDVANLLSLGGTSIKTSRCPRFLEREWRMKGALNLIKKGISKLIVIGGDGSLRGADMLRAEWPEFIAELQQQQLISAQEAEACAHLSIVGMVGSIDNDMCGTEITIGANSSLHRIIEAVDSLASTASSHSRAFVIEVMGRNCGWLALNAWIACGADWLMVPEDPPQEGWEQAMCSTLKRNRQLGKATTMIIVAEGAIDRQNRPITAEAVKDTVVKEMGLDCRVTTLGHVQRGGTTSAFDRFLATLQGVEAVKAVLEEEPGVALLIGINQNKITRKPLMECVEQTKSVADVIKQLNFEEAFNLRDAYFKSNYQMISSLQVSNERDSQITSSSSPKFTVGLINVGAPCGGMNTANRAIVHYCLNRGHAIMGIFNGFSGLLTDDVRELKWSDVDGWVSQGGSELGTNRHLPDDGAGSDSLGKTAMKLQEYKIDALVLVGGFEAFTALLQLAKNRHLYPAFAIPMICLPATVSNNVPGTDFSIGSDTALNSIMEMCDCIKQSASSSRKRLFVVDVQGGYCGYLATVSCLIAGGTYSYIHEEGVQLSDLLRESKHLRSRFADDKRQGRLIIRNERCSPTYTAEVMSKIFEQEAQGSFDSRWVSLGHIVQGGRPSPLDRIRATRLAVMAVNYLEAWLCPEALPQAVKSQFEEIRQRELDAQNVSLMGTNAYLAAAVIGIHGPEVVFTSAVELAEKKTLMRYRIPAHQWWMPLRQLNRILAKYSE